MWRSVSFFKTPFLRQSQVFVLLPSLVCLIILICRFFFTVPRVGTTVALWVLIFGSRAVSPLRSFIIFMHIFIYFTYFFICLLILFRSFTLVFSSFFISFFTYLFIYLFNRTMLKTQNVSSHKLNFKNDRAVQF